MITYAPNIIVIEEEYEIPHLGATRKISALLPHDYYTSDRKYDVIYLQDGQNLFNPQAPFGDWAIDKSLEKLATHGFNDVIIIAIDHGERERIKEYLPYYHSRFGHGKGHHYIQFMKEKLIPYVNSHYRVNEGYQHVGIGGSSMGGLISLYAGLTEPEIFGRMMIFSPSLWISSRIFKLANAFQPMPHSKIYLYAGGKESEAHLPNVVKLETILRSKSVGEKPFDLECSINLTGEHGEAFWRDEFPKAIQWLYSK